MTEPQQKRTESFVLPTENYETYSNPLNIPCTILTDYNDLLSVEDLAKIFNVSKQTIYKELKDGKFGKPIQIGRAYKISKIVIVQNFIANFTK